MAATFCFTAAISLPFYLMGAWPIVGFLGLDVLAIFWAFRLNYRAARAYEQVTVTASTLHVRKVSHRGRVAEWTLNPVWTRLDRQTHEEFGIERLFLVSRVAQSIGEGFLLGRPERAGPGSGRGRCCSPSSADAAA